MKRGFFLVVAGALWLAGVAGTAQAQVQAPWVSTDRTIDCTSFETIVRDLKIAEMKTDEEKALAVYYFFRQRVFHFLNTPESRDPVKNLNAIGYTLCGSQGTCMKALLKAAGLKARVRTNIGHTYYDVFYDGQWHGFDTFANYFVYTRGTNRTIASFEQVIADPTLISDAVKEGRACPYMGPCGDDAMQFRHTRTDELGYEAADTKYSPRNLTLRAGEEIVKTWWSDGKGVMSLTNPQFGPVPLHTCGTKDRRGEPWLFKFWEPYGIPKMGGTTVSYRHATSGQINYAPDLTSPRTLADVGATGVVATPDGLAGAGEMVIPVNSPYYINSGVLVFEATCANEGDVVTVSLAREKEKWAPAALVARDQGKKTYRVKFDASLADGIRHQYWVKIALSGKAVLNHFYLRTGFQYNAMSAPHLMPGKNQITFEVANPEALQATPVTLVYRYRDAPQWSTEQRIEKTITKSPFVFEAALPDTGDKLPQMLDMTWTCGKLAWQAPAPAADKVFADFSRPEAIGVWKANPAITLSHDGAGMLLAGGKAASGSQVSQDVTENWSEFRTIAIACENLAAADQLMCFRARSDADNKERTDIMFTVPGKSKYTMQIPVASLNKTRANAINRIYLMLLDVPEAGAKVRVTKIVLEQGGGL